MSKTLIVVIVLAVATLLIGGIAWAKRGLFCGPNVIMERVAGKLELNQTQTEKLHDFGDALLDLRKQWKENMGQGRDELLTLLESPSLDQNQASTLLEQRHADWRERGPILVEKFAQFSDSLSDEQRLKLRNMIEKRSRFMRHGSMMHRRHLDGG